MWPTIAYLLLTAPCDPTLPSSLTESAPLRTALQELAVELEIMDPRETRWVMTGPDDFEADLHMLRRRYRELADAPRLVDAQRFPNRETIDECLNFNRAFRKNLAAQHCPAREWEINEALVEVDRLHTLWNNVRDAGGEYYYVTARRAALKQVRETIGDEAFARGELPCHVPLHRFRSVD